MCTAFRWVKLQARKRLEDLGRGVKIMQIWIVNKYHEEGALTVLIIFIIRTIGQLAGSFEQGNKLYGSIKCGVFLKLAEELLASSEGLCSGD